MYSDEVKSAEGAKTKKMTLLRLGILEKNTTKFRIFYINSENRQKSPIFAVATKNFGL